MEGNHLEYRIIRTFRGVHNIRTEMSPKIKHYDSYVEETWRRITEDPKTISAFMFRILDSGTIVMDRSIG